MTEPRYGGGTVFTDVKSTVLPTKVVFSHSFYYIHAVFIVRYSILLVFNDWARKGIAPCTHLSRRDLHLVAGLVRGPVSFLIRINVCFLAL